MTGSITGRGGPAADGVPRETAFAARGGEGAPAEHAEPGELARAVEAVFGVDGAPLARRYAHHLTTSAVERGLVGPREVERIWDRHLLNCAVIAPLVPTGARVVDVGSGAGLPGLALALARPDLQVVLVEPLERRATWLGEVVDDLGVPVTVVRARAEEVLAPGPHHVEPADVVTARAVAALDRLARWCLPLVAPGGSMLALKGRTAPDELARAVPVLRRCGASAWEVLSAGDGLIDVPTTVVRVTLGAQRRTGRRGGRV